MSNAFYLNSSSSTSPKNDRDRRGNSASNDSDDVRTASWTTAWGGRETEQSGQNAFFSWNVRITPSAVITVGLLLAILCSAIFFYGVFVGKSNMPISTPVELERLVSDDKKQKDEEDNSQDILPKEELRFMSRLKREQTSGVLAEPEKQNASSVQAESAGSNAAKTNDAKKDIANKEEPAKPKQPQFDYVIRAATYNDKELAQKAASRLNADGLRTRMTQVKTGKKEWHYVQVVLRGSREDLQNIRAVLAKHGMKDAMIIKEQQIKSR